MPIYLLDDQLAFPDPTQSEPEAGIVAIGGDLTPGRLVLAYSLGIFPWYDELVTPILWHCPDERLVLRPHELHIGRTTRRAITRSRIEVRYDTAFEDVIKACALAPRPGQDGTWLNSDMQAAYIELHEQDYAHSAEAWLDGQLVGGLYGVTMGGIFYGESMFSAEPDASKVVFAELIPRLDKMGYVLIDCQVHTEYLARFGADTWPRDTFLTEMRTALMARPRPKWPK